MTTGAFLATTRPGQSRPQRIISSPWWRAAITLGLGTGVLLVAHRATVSDMVSLWSSNASYKVAWFVLPTLAYVLWHTRHVLSRQIPSTAPTGVALAGLCSLLWIASDLLGIAEGRQFALLGSVYAVILVSVGWRVFRFLLPFLSLLLFLVPTGRFLLEPLKQSAVGLTQLFAGVSGLPFEATGFAISVGSKDYVIIDDCAALPYVLIGLFFGLSLGLLIYRRWWKIAALALFGGGLAVLANGFRILGIITYDYVTGSELTLTQHFYLELPAMAAACAVLFLVFSKLKRDPTPARAGARPPVPDAARPARIWWVSVAVILISAAPLWHAATPSLSTGSIQAPHLPSTLLDWSWKQSGTDWQPRATAGSTRSSLAHYENGSRQLSVFVAGTASRSGKVSGGAVDLVGNPNWLPSQTGQVSVCAAGFCRELHSVKLHLRNSRRVRHLYVAYAVGHETMTSPLALRLARARHLLSGSAAPARVIAIAIDDTTVVPPREVVSIMEALAIPSATTESIGP